MYEIFSGDVSFNTISCPNSEKGNEKSYFRFITDINSVTITDFNIQLLQQKLLAGFVAWFFQRFKLDQKETLKCY